MHYQYKFSSKSAKNQLPGTWQLTSSNFSQLTASETARRTTAVPPQEQQKHRRFPNDENERAVFSRLTIHGLPPAWEPPHRSVDGAENTDRSPSEKGKMIPASVLCRKASDQNKNFDRIPVHCGKIHPERCKAAAEIRPAAQNPATAHGDRIVLDIPPTPVP